MAMTVFTVICTILVATSSLISAANGNRMHHNDGSGASSLLDTLQTFTIVRPSITSSPFTSSSASNKHATDDTSTNGDVLHYTITMAAGHYQLELRRATDLFHPDYQEVIMDNNGRVVDRRRKQIDTNCYYRGHVIGATGSSVTMSTCSQPSLTDMTSSSSSSSTPSMRRMSTVAAPFAAQFSQFRAEANTGASSASTSEGSLVSLTGVIALAGESPLFIEPANSHAHQLSSWSLGDHIIYRLADVTIVEESSCGIGHHHEQHIQSDASDDHVHASSSSFRTEALQPSDRTSATNANINNRFTTQMNGAAKKYVEVMVFNDKKRFDLRGAATMGLSNQIMNQVASLYTNAFALRFAYAFEIRLVAQVTFAYGDPYVAPSSQGGAGEVSFSDLLNKFSNWQDSATLATTIAAHDSAVLLSGYDFAGGVVGYANVGGMCGSGGASSAVIQATSSKPLQTASVVAHEMGHNFNMQHDDRSDTTPLFSTTFQNTWCAAQASLDYKIMATSSSSAVFPTVWSNCSQIYIDDWFDGTPSASTTPGYGAGITTQCLENIPTRQWTNASVCGDGVRSGSEQCDCGLNDCATVDPCCDGTTCMLTSVAVCSNLDPCCESCAIVTDARVCRAAANADCDVAETCNGVTASCPSDISVRPGSSCTWSGNNHTGSGRCYGASCLSHDQQCWQQYPAVAKLFDVATLGYSGECFTLSDFNGVAACGELACGTNPSPVLQGCINYDIGEGPTTVFDGVPCGTGMQCYGAACVSSTSLPYIDTIGAHWLVGSYGQCSSACGGTQTRSVQCVNSANVTVLSGFCSLPSPSVSIVCAANSSCGYDWNVGQYSVCSSTCIGISTRLVDCRDKVTNAVMNMTYCSAATKPVSVIICNSAIACTSTGGSTSRSSTGRASSTAGGQSAQTSDDVGFFGNANLDKVLAGKFTVGGLLILLLGIAILCFCICCKTSQRQQEAAIAKTNAAIKQNIAEPPQSPQPSSNEPSATELSVR